jgi:hypothetical protein
LKASVFGEALGKSSRRVPRGLRGRHVAKDHQRKLRTSGPDKTRLIEFGRFAVRNRKQRGEGKPETFTFLGFTHFCRDLTSSGALHVWRLTAKKRMVAKLNVIKAELQHRKHHRTRDVGTWLQKVVQGYYQYHAVPGNTGQLRVFRRRVCRLWRSVLVRRSQRAQVGWDRLNPLLNRWIPPLTFCILILTSASTPFILGKSRMRKRARTDLCGNRPAMVVPTATVISFWCKISIILVGALMSSFRIKNSHTNVLRLYQPLYRCAIYI